MIDSHPDPIFTEVRRLGNIKRSKKYTLLVAKLMYLRVAEDCEDQMWDKVLEEVQELANNNN